MRPYLIAGLVLLSLGFMVAIDRMEVARRALLTQKALWQKSLASMESAVSHAQIFQTLKQSDMAQFKTGFSGTAKSQKDLFESGLSLQEERRLLEKQLEIMTTTLNINPSLQRIFLLREGQPLQSYLLGYFPLRAFGGAPPVLPETVRIVSKERFAHPERGKAEMVNGQLQWTPPQVGTSVRARALGEYVMFTNSKLILHGPPVSEEDHAALPAHLSGGLDQETARKLYHSSFIGTHIQLSHAAIESDPSNAPTLSSRHRRHQQPYMMLNGRWPLGAADNVTLCGLLIAMITLGVLAGRHRVTTRDFFLSSRKIPAWAVCLSMIATEVSAAHAGRRSCHRVSRELGICPIFYRLVRGARGDRLLVYPHFLCLQLHHHL